MASPAVAAAVQGEQMVIIAVTSTMLAICSVAFALRVIVKTLMVSTWRWDDSLLTVSYMLFLAVCGVTYAIVGNKSAGSHDGYMIMTQLIRAHNALCCLSIIFVRASLGVFFLHIFKAAIYRMERYLIIVTTAIPTVLGMVNLGFIAVACYTSVSLLFGEECQLASHFSTVSISWVVANLASDVTLSLLSVWALCQLRGLSRLARCCTCILMVLGTTGGLASIARLVIQVLVAANPMLGVQIPRWYNLEVGLCIAATSLAALRPLVQRANCAIRSCSSNQSRRGTRDSSGFRGGGGGGSNNLLSAVTSSAGSFARSGRRRDSRSRSGAPTLTSKPSYHSGDCCDAFWQTQTVTRAYSETESGTVVRGPSFVFSDHGSLLALEKGAEIVVTREVDVIGSDLLAVPGGHQRTRSVCFGGTFLDGKEVLGVPKRPDIARTKSSQN